MHSTGVVFMHLVYTRLVVIVIKLEVDIIIVAIALHVSVLFIKGDSRRESGCIIFNYPTNILPPKTIKLLKYRI